ncbi:MAG: LUD domain-containing protein [bacterium]
MSRQKTVELNKKIQQALQQNAQRTALLTAVKRGRDARAKAFKEWPGSDELRAQVRATKEKHIAQLEELLTLFTEKARKRGAHVIFMKTGQDACDYVLKLAREKQAQLITKSKSLTTEEIDLNRPLEQAGLQVVETDLGERIIQMAGEAPYHLVFPAVHKTTRQVAELFSQATGEKVKSQLGDIMSLMRRSLRPLFINADIGVTGVNVAIAETGAVLIETNEGNGRLVSSLPPVQICIMGVEKIVETFEDAMQMILAHPISAVGQLLTTYVSFFAGRSPLGQNKERELHILILDNGRSEMRADSRFREALYCIRCGACMNICPTYGVLGGHVFGHIYPGPIGIPWTARVHGLDKAAGFSDLCISCGLCKEICPADIDLPMMIARVKQEILKTEPQSLANRVLMANERIAKIACATTPFSNWLLQSPVVKKFSEKFLGLDKRRNLPRFTPTPFKKQFQNIDKFEDSASDGEPRVALFVDYFANYIKPEIAVCAAKIFKKARVELVLPNQKASGYPYISYGEIGKARKSAEFNVKNLFPLVRQGFDVVTTEPTAAYALKQVYPKLLDYSDASLSVASKSYLFFEYIAKLQEEGVLLFPLQITENRQFGLHVSCHQRSGESAQFTLHFLHTLGFEVVVIENGTCCGMAGTFGFKKGPLGFELSATVGEPLFELFKSSGVDAILTESSVCRMQLSDFVGLEVLHPMELLLPLSV